MGEKHPPKKEAGADAGRPNGKRPPWSPEERQFLEENHKTMGDAEIARRLSRSKRGVSHMRNRLSLGPPKRVPIDGISWTREMDATLLRNPGTPPEEMARLLGRTKVAVMHRRRLLGMTKSRSEIAWRPDEDSILRANPDKHPKWLAERLKGRTVAAIRRRRKTLGLPPYITKSEWSEQDIRTLESNLQAPMGDLAKMLPGKSESAIRGMARKLGRKRVNREGYSIINGYISRYKDGKMLLDHHLVMERKIGRKLKPGEVVHHINCVKTDNRPGNLDLLPDEGAHNSAHRSMRQLLPDLLGMGVVRYDEGKHSYEVVKHG